MQIFRISSNHRRSAMYLDNRRLSKQVLELYQIIRVCLAALNIIEGNTRYLNHPIVKHVYNDGHPYIIDCFLMLTIMDEEHRRRGGNRSETFQQYLQRLKDIIDDNINLFSNETMPPYYVFGTDKIYGDQVFDAYRNLLHQKWKQDKIAPRCGIK
ncbi:pyrimidine dimer DNA glycosylase/endonuclease V [Macrococcus animalis]|uniref:pyrimidine dimer DNA glycosylase/endonuclease V n=1 Tax=Macrococcus animalis TaxID=3395467 RepID=UPI0039BE0F9D